MTGALSIAALGFFLGMRHAADADHVIAVATIVSRHRSMRQAALVGILWGLGHTLTIVLVGAAIILFNVVIPPRVGLGMELGVGVVLIMLGLANISRFLRMRRVSTPSQDAAGVRAVDGSSLYGTFRPIVVGIVHGLAGSSAVALLVLAAIRDPRWATAYLIVFGTGTIAGMVLVTVSMASAFQFTGARSSRWSGRVGLASGFLSLVFGLFLAYQICVNGLA
jgi:cytochrome c biogenesis protein CcdA